MTTKAEWYAPPVEWQGYQITQMQAAGLASDTALLASYYDGQACAFWLADYTSDTTTYHAHADVFNTAYAVNYGRVYGWSIPGYWAFGRGLAERYTRLSDAAALTDLQNLCANAAYHASGSLPVSNVDRHELSREWSYVVMNLLDLKRVASISAGQQSRLDACYADLLTIGDDWYTNETASYVRPFMVGLWARALIQFYEEEATAGEKTTIQAAITAAANYIWTHCWNEAGGAFLYTDRVGTNPPDAWAAAEDGFPQPDLNLLIAPMFAWLWSRTATSSWYTKAGQILDGGATVYDGMWWQSGAYLGTRSADNPNGKHIDQQLTWGVKFWTYYGATATGATPAAGEGAATSGLILLGCGAGGPAQAGVGDWVAGDHGTIVYHADFSAAAKCLNNSDAQAADGEGIKTITDSGPNAINLTQATAGYRPTLQTNEINGYQIARFDAGDGWGLSNAQSSTMAKNRTGLTIAMVLKPNSLAAVGRFLKFNGPAAQRLYIGLLDTGRWNINITPQDAGVAQDLYTDLGTPLTIAKFWVTVIQINCAGNAVKAWIDGTEVLNDADIGSTGNFSNTDAAGDGDSNHLFFNYYGANGINADVAEVVLWDGALADSVCNTDITDGLMTKYGL